jgi:hypothetical protein
VAQESPDVPAVMVDGIAGRRLVGKPSSPQIHGPNLMRGRQGGGNPIPAPAICGQAVNTENIAPLPFPYGQIDFDSLSLFFSHARFGHSLFLPAYQFSVLKRAVKFHCKMRILRRKTIHFAICNTFLAGSSNG